MPVVACADDGGGGGGGRAAIPAGVVLATAVEPVVAHLAGGGEPDSPAAILQAVVVQVELVVLLAFSLEVLDQIIVVMEQVVHLHKGVKEVVLLVDLE